MLVEAIYPTRFDAAQYDHLLANGFFRGASMMYKTQLLCIGNKVSSVINIRLPLENHEFSKSQRRLKSKVEKRFRIKVHPYYTNKEHDRLYHTFKQKFRGFLYPDIESFLSLGSPFAFTIFNTHIIEIFDGDKLIGFSLFDFGAKACAGLLAVYDLDYAKYSLGKYTLLKEIEIAKYEGYNFYYPGYILNNDKTFDYKVCVGNVEKLNWNIGWQHTENLRQGDYLSDEIEAKTNTALAFTKANGFEGKLFYYPNFSLGYLMNIPRVFTFPVYIQLFNSGISGDIYLYYDHFKKEYVLGSFQIISVFPRSERLEISDEYLNSAELDLNIKENIQVFCRTADLTEIKDVLELFQPPSE